MRRPRTQPRTPARITDKEVVKYDSLHRRLEMRVQIDGVDYFETAHDVQVAEDGLHQEVLSATAERMRRKKEGERGANAPRISSDSKIEEKEVVSYDADEKKLYLRIRIDGKDYFQTHNKSLSPHSIDHNAVLDDTADYLLKRIKERNAEAASEALGAGVGDWAAMPEGPEKQRIAQQVMRDCVNLAREGKRLQADGRTRSQAFESYAQIRSRKAKIWDNLSGTHVEKAAYLALEGPGDGTEYGDLNAFMNDLGNAAPDWAAVTAFMDTCTNPQRVKTSMSV